MFKAPKSVYTIKTRVTCDYVGSDTCTVTSLAQGVEVSQVALSCDGLTLASGDTGGGVTLWDTASGRGTIGPVDQTCQRCLQSESDY